MKGQEVQNHVRVCFHPLVQSEGQADVETLEETDVCLPQVWRNQVTSVLHSVRPCWGPRTLCLLLKFSSST